ncbi:MAG: hypothetical protein UY16_C0010G0016 [Candidatus Gottesmanbacteria bacterium GW2011_GWA2_47_9]|uniref:DUF192 domain-containing protein n=1 Tax=Candidatus Gottesmanbacteria bacterium GW2011_GWA2_47_9 TaxID=1618445 RepID=A0A0G1X1F1_9BACT|nr:MAG: hypothetical protein UY16_C0010G0016 [Candidatus Gottesmanbacteria bacterium GW2011_GWA2_47_9]
MARTGKDILSESARGRKLGAASAATHSPHLPFGRRPPVVRAIIRDQTFTIETAVTREERELGLGNRKTMPMDHGMVFLFGVRGKYDFWMRGMQFPLDFLWIGENKILDITTNVPPPVGNEPPVQLTAKVPVDKILELNAGTVSRLRIQIGDEITFVTN